MPQQSSQVFISFTGKEVIILSPKERSEVETVYFYMKGVSCLKNYYIFHSFIWVFIFVCLFVCGFYSARIYFEFYLMYLMI